MRNVAAIESRQEKILELVRKNSKVTIKELCDTFGMSVVTIRNDLILLEEQGLVIRTHGGAVAVQDRDGRSDGKIIPFDLREEKNLEVKQRIGKAAADLVNDGEVIFIDGGTTASEMRHYLKDKKDITIITPSIVVTYWLAVTSNLNIYVLNGFFKRSSYSTVGVPSMDFLADWNLSKAFFGAAGFTDSEGLSDLNVGFVEQKKVIAQKSRMNIGLIDSSKWGILSLGVFVSPGDIDMIISDTVVSAEQLENARDKGIEVRLV
jgi:DeoR/GlpR family transcriptional regulator of sugar metabolism